MRQSARKCLFYENGAGYYSRAQLAVYVSLARRSTVHFFSSLCLPIWRHKPLKRQPRSQTGRWFHINPAAAPSFRFSSLLLSLFIAFLSVTLVFFVHFSRQIREIPSALCNAPLFSYNIVALAGAINVHLLPKLSFFLLIVPLINHLIWKRRTTGLCV